MVQTETRHFPGWQIFSFRFPSRTPMLEMPHLVSAKVVLPARRVRPPSRETEHPNLQKPSLLA